ncbi:MAG: hypothetical protein B6I26_08300 [Desulfobacteraceae bacterium 4572_130]|nr:MAG: hypothetical protein B6I26_08300 [Desulfobacteraceae bacterium 4572_130]
MEILFLICLKLFNIKYLSLANFSKNIKKLSITLQVDKLKKNSVKHAINNSFKKAETYIKMGIIYNALAALDNELVLTNKFNTMLSLLQYALKTS